MPVGVTRRKVPQRTDRRWAGPATGRPQARVKRCGKSAPAPGVTRAARQTPPGARSSRGKAGPAAALGRRPRVDRTDGWPPRRREALDRTPPTGRLTVTTPSTRAFVVVQACRDTTGTRAPAGGSIGRRVDPFASGAEAVPAVLVPPHAARRFAERRRAGHVDQRLVAVGTIRAGGDGEPACRRGSVQRLSAPGWPSICAVHLGTSAGPAVPCSTLLRVGVTEPPGSPPTLVRSYRTLSPLPVRAGARHRRFPLCGPDPTGHPVLAHTSTRALWSPDFPRQRRSAAAATWPAHRR